MNTRSPQSVLLIILIALQSACLFYTVLLSRKVRAIAAETGDLRDAAVRMDTQVLQERQYMDRMNASIEETRQLQHELTKSMRTAFRSNMQRFDDTLREIEGYPVSVPGKTEELAARLRQLSEQMDTLLKAAERLPGAVSERQ